MNKDILIIVLGLIVLAAVWTGWQAHLATQGPLAVACTADARMCPDGTGVGREGPNCEFAQCPITGTDPKNLTYGIDQSAVTLTNGVSEIDVAPGSASKITTRYFGNEATGDFDGNGTEDTAFLLTQESGGSGTFFYVVAALADSAGGYRGTNAVFLGDRIAPQTTEFREGMIIVNFAERAEGEPMTSEPSVGKSLRLLVENGMLVPLETVR